MATSEKKKAHTSSGTSTGSSGVSPNLATVVKRKGRAPVDPNETKPQKLQRLGEKRVAQALSKIRLIGNLAAYKPTDAQVDNIMTALGESCARLEARLRGTRQDSYVFRMN